MSLCKKTVGIVSLTAIVALGLGGIIGVKLKNGPSFSSATALNTKSLDELSASLSDIMLPEDEYNKLGDAIFQSAMGLFMAQAQSSGITVNEAAESELKKSINAKYSRKFFTDMNASSMKELSLEDLVAIIGFYHTESGQKFLKLSPKIIENTMTSIQTDLSKWLPTAVDSVVAKLKSEEGKEQPKTIPNNPQSEGTGEKS